MEIVGHVADLRDHFRRELSVVAPLDFRQSFRMGRDDIAEAPQHSTAFARREVGPNAGSQGPIRRKNRVIDVLRGTARH